MARLLAFVAAVASLLGSSYATAEDQPPESVPYQLSLIPDVRGWYRNPDGSCVQCSIGMAAISANCPQAYTLLWDTKYGPKVRGGSGPGRVEAYAEQRSIPIYNVTGSSTFEWMKWAARTRRFAAIGAGRSHFQTLYGWNPASDTWYVCNNNSTGQIDAYSSEDFKRLHLASGQWVVVIDMPPSAAIPAYLQWWN